MLCFNHSDTPARCLCKSCNRALCLQCTSEVGKSLACKNRCEDDVRNLDDMLRKSLQVTNQPAFNDIAAVARTGVTAITTAELFNVVLGAIFLIYGAYKPNTFIAVLGAAFVAFGLFGLVRGRLAARGIKSPTAE
jgi:hypothetical protein